MPTCKIEFHNYSLIIFSDRIALVLSYIKLCQTITLQLIQRGKVALISTVNLSVILQYLECSPGTERISSLVIPI